MITVSSIAITIAGRSSFNITVSSSEAQGVDQEVDRLDADERHDDASKAVDQQVAAQERAGTDRTKTDAPQGKRDQGDDDQRVEDDRGQDRTLGEARPITFSVWSWG